MITNITLQNFKCFRRISVDPKLITVFIGPNGTGKSGVLQALLLLKQSRYNVDPLVLDGELVRFEPESFMWRGPESELDDVQLSLSGQSPIESKEVHEPVEFEVDLQYSGWGNLTADDGSTKWVTSGEEYEIYFDRDDRRPIIPTSRGEIGYVVLPAINSFRVTLGYGGEEPSLPIWDELSQAPAKMLANVKMVPAARGLTRGVYELGPESSEDISGASGLGAQEDKHRNDPGLLPTRGGEGFPSDETGYWCRLQGRHRSSLNPQSLSPNLLPVTSTFWLKASVPTL